MPIARSSRWSAVLVAVVAMIAPAASAQSPLDVVLKTVPADAQAAIIVPHLKVLSDQITQCLEGMDRANLLMGSRPIDQMKSAAGFNSGIDDLGGVAWVFPAGDADVQPVLIVPVSDAKAFLEGNFASHDGDAYKRADGTISYAKVMDKHIVLGPDAALVKAWAPGEGIGPWLKNAMSERGGVVMYAGEVLLMARGGAAQRFNSLQQFPAIPGVPVNAISDIEAALGDDLDAVVMTLDVDPLGLIWRSYAKFKDGTAGAEFAKGGTNGAAGAGLSRVPSKPFYFAMAADVAGLGGAEAMNRITMSLGMADFPKWVQQSQSVQFAVYPSPAGISGGLLNDAVAIVTTSDPAAAKAFVKEQILASKDIADGIKREVKWEDQKAVKDAGNADAYEVKVTDVPQGMEQQQMVSRVVFGQVGWRGFIRQMDDGLLMTFSQRPAVLQAATAAATEGKADNSKGLASAAAVKMMRNWMPPHTDIEAYLGMGQLGQLLKQIAASVPMLGEANLPELDASLPPIGFGVELNQGGVEMTTVVPAGVLTMLFDRAMEAMAAQAGRNAQP